MADGQGPAGDAVEPASVADVPGDVSTRTWLAAGEPIAGSIAPGGDRDWYLLRLEAGTCYVVDAEGRDTGAGTLSNPVLWVRDSAGHHLFHNFYGGEGENARVGIVADEDGYLFIDVSGDATGTYRLSASEIVDDVPDGTASAVAIGVQRPIRGSIDWGNSTYGDHSDHDAYRLGVTAGTTYVVDLKGVDSAAGTLADPWLRVLDAGGHEIASDGDGGEGRDARLSFTAAADGIVHVEAGGGHWHSLGPGSELVWDGTSGSYRLSVDEVADDAGDSAGTAASLAVGRTVDASILAPTDSDWFEVGVVAGQSYVFRASGTGHDAVPEPWLNLRDARGQSIRGGAGEAGLTATADGRIFVEVRSGHEGHDLNDDWSFIPSNGGTYRLSAILLPDEVAEDASTTAVLDVGGRIRGIFDFVGDTDWYRVTLEGERTYRVDCDGYELGLLDAGGTVLATSAGSLGYRATVVGNYYIAAANPYGASADYALSLDAIVGDVPDSMATTSTIVSGGHVDSVVDFQGDSDWFRLETTAGSIYRFDLTGFAEGATRLGAPELRLIDSAGGELLAPWWSDSSDRSLAYLATVDGPVWLAVGDEDVGTGGYRLSATTIVDDVGPNPTALRIDEPVVGRIDFQGDRDLYRVELTAGRTWAVTVDEADLQGARPIWPALRLLDSEGDEVRPLGGVIGQTAHGLGYIPVASGPYQVEVTGIDSDVGSFRLGVAEVVGDQPDSAATDAVLGAGEHVDGRFDYAGDRDWFRLQVEAGGIYRLELGFPPGERDDAFIAALEFHDEDSLGHRLNSEVFAADRAGTLLIEVLGEDHLESHDRHLYSLSPYRLSVSSITDAIGSDAGSAASLRSGKVSSSSFDYAGDVDWYRVDVTEGHHYRFLLELVGVDEASPVYAQLTIRDAHGNLIGGDEGTFSQGGQELLLAAGGEGEVFVAASAEGGSGYQLHVEEVGDTLPVDPSVSEAVPVGGSTAGSLDARHPTETFRVTLEAGHSYDFDLEGAATAAGSLRSAMLELGYPGGNGLRHDEAGGVGGNARISFTATSDGDALLTASGLDGATGSYRLSAREAQGGLWRDLPDLFDDAPVSRAALQAAADDAPAAGGEVFLTWLGGGASYDSAIGVCRITDDGTLTPSLALASTRSAAVGQAISLGTVHIEDRLGLFAIADGADAVTGLEPLAEGVLALRRLSTGEIAHAGDTRPPELVRLDGATPARVDADLLFGFDDDPSSPLANPLNRGGGAQATVGSFWRDGVEVCRVMAFEDLLPGNRHRDGDFDDALVALSVGRLSAADLAAILDWAPG